MVISLLILIVLVGLLLAIKDPNLFVLYYLFFALKGFGFVNFDQFLLVNGRSLHMTMLSLTAVLSIICLAISNSKYSIKKIDLCLYLTLMYPFVLAIIYYHHSPTETFVQGKDLFSYAFLIYALNRNITAKYFCQLTLCISFYYATILLLPIPAQVFTSFYNVGADGTSSIRVAVPMLFIGAIIAMRRVVFGSFKFIPVTIIVIAGILTNYMTILLGILVLIFTKKVKIFTIICTCIISFIVIMVDFEASSISVISRFALNAERLNMITDSYFLGWGFVGENFVNNIGYRFEGDNRFTNTISVVDAGYIDLFLRFGLPGGLLFLICLVLFLRSHVSSEMYQTFYVVIFITLLINATYAVFTSSNGILGMSVLILCINRKQQREA